MLNTVNRVAIVSRLSLFLFLAFVVEWPNEWQRNAKWCLKQLPKRKWMENGWQTFHFWILFFFAIVAFSLHFYATLEKWMKCHSLSIWILCVLHLRSIPFHSFCFCFHHFHFILSLLYFHSQWWRNRLWEICTFLLCWTESKTTNWKSTTIHWIERLGFDRLNCFYSGFSAGKMCEREILLKLSNKYRVKIIPFTRLPFSVS